RARGFLRGGEVTDGDLDHASIVPGPSDRPIARSPDRPIVSSCCLPPAASFLSFLPLLLAVPAPGALEWRDTPRAWREHRREQAGVGGREQDPLQDPAG